MKHLITFVCLLLAGEAALASGTVEETRPFKEGGNLMVINTAGSVKIEGWRKNEVQVKAELGDDAEDLLVDYEDDDLLIKVVNKKKKAWGRDQYPKSSTKLLIRAPYSASLKVKTVSADVDIKDIRGEQRIRTVSGDLKTTLHESPVELRTVSGDLYTSGQGKSPKAKLYSVSGTIDVRGVSGFVWAEAVSGDVEIRGENVSEAHFKTVSGDIEVVLGLTRDAEVHMESVSGDVEAVLPRGFEAEYELTSFSGDISDIFGVEPKRKSKYAPGSELSYRHGKSDARVRANTLSGDIELEFGD